MRTFSREHFEKSREAWRTGEFGEEWRPFREQAAQRGMIYPPEGTRHDDRDVENPSQRAIIYETLRDNPGLLRQAIARSHSWHGVVDYLIGRIDALREDADLREREAAWEKGGEPNPRQATRRIGEILERIADSKGIVLTSGQNGQARKSPTLTDDEASNGESTAAAARTVAESVDRAPSPGSRELRGSGSTAEPGVVEATVRMNGATEAPKPKES